MVTVLGLALGAGAAYSPVDTVKITSIGHAVVTAPLVARPAAPDQNALPAAALVLVVALGSVLVRQRRVAPLRRPCGPRPTGRAPPGPLAHR